jgi:hypothetical protein
MRDALDPDHWMNGGECDHPHPDALAMDALDTENKQLRAEVERLREAQRWIPAEERLPEIGARVLVSDKRKPKADCDEFLGHAGNGQPVWLKGLSMTHWMPLPELPKEVQE